MSQSNKKSNFNRRISIIGIAIALAGVIVPLAMPEIRCFLFPNSCPPSPTKKEVKEVTLITQTETGEPLAGVKVIATGTDVPELQYTDSNGYANVRIASEGKVHVNLSKPGSSYQPKDFTYDLVDQNTTRTYRFTKDGQIEDKSVPTVPPNSPTPTPTISSPETTRTSEGVNYDKDPIKATALGASFDRNEYAQAGLIIENKSEKDLLLAVEHTGVRAISDSGQSSECRLEGLKSINISAIAPNPLSFSKLKSKTTVTISVSNCTGITPASKANSLNVNIPLVMLENDKYATFILPLSGIPIKK
ncbi:carboxypeptidase regulatory-like domain-containing protein [Nostocaceae cyanobacterium CENA369]|uniref:Carboxypeptidase regulatory-like domain-containing protein n=1 Tax=Dendronalium phyllosphericum CENA369 TaxID=1725256 RepID=A0A8J7I0B0_9NOST|nr:hypothetical protein [Dendronalium phyllosphericum]MBH8573614.1 carboxypeptidase regulatory-like domain-containing protein [Dendronalium phyllosphericum CENA369]